MDFIIKDNFNYKLFYTLLFYHKQKNDFLLSQKTCKIFKDSLFTKDSLLRSIKNNLSLYNQLETNLENLSDISSSIFLYSGKYDMISLASPERAISIIFLGLNPSLA